MRTAGFSASAVFAIEIIPEMALLGALTLAALADNTHM
jgi:hypothetical protein